MAATPCRLDSLEWMLGSWTTAAGKQVIREEWTRVSTDTWEGAGRTIAGEGGAVLSGESLRLVEMAGGVFYLAKVDHNELPTAFRLTECSASHAVFENPAHDFPRKLDYRLSPDGQLTVLVSDGADKGFRLEFTRE